MSSQCLLGAKGKARLPPRMVCLAAMFGRRVNGRLAQRIELPIEDHGASPSEPAEHEELKGG